MFIELVELLRCTREHEESWLVASIDELRERSIISGTLGCPVCSAQYPIASGVADFSDGATRGRGSAALSTDPEDLGLRAGAFLGLGETTGVALLGGSWAAGAGSLSAALDVRIFAANAEQRVEESAAVGLVSVADVIPLGAMSCAGIALDDSFSAAAFESAARRLKPGGRLVLPRSFAVPKGMALLAQDESWSVAEKPPEITTLSRASR